MNPKKSLWLKIDVILMNFWPRMPFALFTRLITFCSRKFEI